MAFENITMYNENLYYLFYTAYTRMKKITWKSSKCREFIMENTVKCNLTMCFNKMYEEYNVIMWTQCISLK